jgi:hypothetical protein
VDTFVSWWRRPALVCVVVLAVSSSAGAIDARLEVQLPEGAVTVGDAVAVRVLARGAGDLLWGELTARLGHDDAWALRDGPREVPGSSPPVWELTLVPLKTGELEIPVLEAGIRAGDGEPEAVTAPAQLAVTVASVLGPEDQGEPAPLKAPLGVQGFPWEWVAPIVALLMPIAIALWWWRRRLKMRDQTAAAPSLSPIEELTRTLQDLADRIGREPAELVCDRLASGVRRYLERRTGEPAAEMTSHELQVLARRSEWPGDVQSALLKVTRVADGVRFGRTPTEDRDLGAVRELALDLARGLEAHFTPPPVDEEVA